MDRSFSSHPLCCHSVLLPESSTSVCEVCLSLSRPSFTSSSVRCSFPPTAQGGDVLQSYLRHCCLHQLPAPVSIQTATTVGCSNFLNSYSPFSQYSACCRKVEPQLNESRAKEGTDMHRVHLTPPSSTIPPYSAPLQAGDGIKGLRCQTNRTLRFYVLDVALNWPLAVRLGALGNRSASGDGSGDGLFAAIVNLRDEVHYVLQHSPAATLTESLGKNKITISFILSCGAGPKYYSFFFLLFLPCKISVIIECKMSKFIGYISTQQLKNN